MLGLLTTMLVLFVLVPGSFAQGFVQLQVSNQPSASEIQTNRDAATWDPTAQGTGILVFGTFQGSGTTTSSVLRISFPGPITSSPALCGSISSSTFNPLANANCANTTNLVGNNVPLSDPIRIEGQGGIFANVSNPVLNTASSRIEVVLPGGSGFITTGGVTTGQFRLFGVRFDANGKSGAQTGSVTLSDPTGYVLTSTPTQTYVNGFGPGIGNMAIGASGGNQSLGTASIFTNRAISRAQGSLIITEGFASAWRTRTQNAATITRLAPNSTQIRLTFNNVPTGVTLNVAVSVDSSTFSSLKAGFGAGNSCPSVPAGCTTTITSSANTATIEFTGTSLSSTETLQLTITVASVSSTAAVGTPGAITVTATMFPIGDGVDNSDPTRLQVPTEAAGYPQVVQADVGPVAVVNIVAANTTMLLPYFAIVGQFDTGIAISNTTADAFGVAGGGANPSAGTIKVDIFPTAQGGGAGTPVSLTTSATARPGAGLSSDGTLAAGAVWTTFMSEILRAAGSPTTNMTGYAFISTNFLNAHGASTLTDFKTFSFTPGIFVMPPPSANSRSNLKEGVEMLAP